MIPSSRRSVLRSSGQAVQPSSVIRNVVLPILSPFLEKNPLKTFSLDVPVVFSMTRLIVLAFAVALLRQIWRAGIAGWPDAMLSIAIVVALPVVGALDRAKASEVVSFAKALVGRFGAGDIRPLGSVFNPRGEEPSKYDDHRDDDNAVDGAVPAARSNADA